MIPNWQCRPRVVDLTGADIEQCMGMAHRDFGLLLDIPIGTYGPQEQQGPAFFETDSQGAILLLREEALDLAHPTPLPLDETDKR